MTNGFAGLAPCVHCGFCLQACPTFLETGDEADGPRGRIQIMQGLDRGTVAPTDADATRHLDRCLGCRACEPVCPSGVAYGPALEEARHLIARHRGVPWPTRLILTLMAEPALRAPILGASRLLRPIATRLEASLFVAAMLAASRPWRDDGAAGASRAPDDPKPPEPDRAGTIFLGCVQQDLFGHVHDATARTLSANGYRLEPTRGQGCCGALHAHAGVHDAAVRLARSNVRAFAGVPDAEIIVNSAGCGAMLRSYGAMLAGDPLAEQAQHLAHRVRDVSEALAGTGPRAGASLPLRVAYDPPCHLAHAQRVCDPPLKMLAAIPELDVIPHEEDDLCCGSAGIYSLLQPAMSRAVLARKVAALKEARPDVLASGNPGCLMHIGAGLRTARLNIATAHPVELLDASYARAGYYPTHG